MGPDQFAALAIPGALSGFAIVLWWLARKLWERLDKQDDKTDEIKTMLAMEMRLFEARLSVVEFQLGITRK